MTMVVLFLVDQQTPAGLSALHVMRQHVLRKDVHHKPQLCPMTEQSQASACTHKHAVTTI